MMDNTKILKADDYSEKVYRCDYLVIGTGAGGSVAGALLAEKGYKVIFLEEGGYYPTSSFTGKVGELTAKLYRNGGIFPFLGSPLIALAEGCCVGGGTLINGAGIFRTPKWVLDSWQNSGLKGYSYSDLEKHFDTVDQDLNVAYDPLIEGKNLDTIKLVEGADKLGWRTEKVPRAARNCDYKNSCSVGCPTGAKQSTLVTYLPRALKAGARIFSDCRAVKIKHSDDLAQSVVVQVVGKKQKIKIKFDNLMVAAGAIQTPHLLRRSKISKLAGKNLQFHMNVKIIACLNEPIYAERGTMFPIQVHEFESENAYINTSVVQPSYLAMSLSSHGNKIIDHALKNYDKMIIFNTTIGVESKAHIMSWMGKDPLVRYRFNQADSSRLKASLRRMSKLLFQCGAVEIYLPISEVLPVRSLDGVGKVLRKTKAKDIGVNTVHMMASCPMGSDPKTSVVDLNGKVWGMKNIWITDASILPSNFGQSPQGTIVAFVHEVMGRHFEKKEINFDNF